MEEVSGVKYFKNSNELEKYINGDFENSIDGITLLQGI